MGGTVIHHSLIVCTNSAQKLTLMDVIATYYALSVKQAQNNIHVQIASKRGSRSTVAVLTQKLGNYIHMYMYVYKCKNISTKMFKDVGIEVQ